LDSLKEKHYQTKGERIQLVSRCLAKGKYLIVEHQGHTHFCYQITNPKALKKEQTEFNLQKEDDYLISVKNPQQPSSPGTGLGEKQKVNYPIELQKKFSSYRFINLDIPEFLDYSGAEILLVSQPKQKLTERYKDLQTCLEKVDTDNLVKEFRFY